MIRYKLYCFFARACGSNLFVGARIILEKRLVLVDTTSVSSFSTRYESFVRWVSLVTTDCVDQLEALLLLVWMDSLDTLLRLVWMEAGFDDEDCIVCRSPLLDGTCRCSLSGGERLEAEELRLRLSASGTA